MNYSPLIATFKIMDGKKLIEYICVLLDNQDKRLTDSNIVIQLRTMTQHELTTLVNKDN